MTGLIREWPSSTGKSIMRAYRTQRRTGVRIQIVRPDGTVLFDTDDCYDMGNAINRADLYAQEHLDEL